MAEYRVTGPDGTRYKVTGPDGASDEQVLSQIKAYSQSAPAEQAAPPDLVPGAQYLKPQAEQKPTSLTDKLMGIPDAAATLARSAAAGPIGGVAGFGSALTSGKFGTPAGVEAGRQTAESVSRRIQGQPATETGRSIVSGVGEAFDKSKLAGLNPSQAMALGSIPRPPVLAPAASAAGKAVGNVARKAGQAMGKGMDPQVAELARKAEAMGIKVTPDMLSDNKFVRLMGQASREVPASGSPVAGNREAFNRMIVKAFGGDDNAKKITPAVFEKAMNTHGETIGDISGKYPIPYNPDLQARFAKHAANAKSFETSDVAKIINSYTAEIADLGRMKGYIDGIAFRKVRTKLTSQMRRTNNGDLKHALSELDDEMLNAIEAQLSPQDLQSFHQARQYYANGKTVEPLIAKAASKGLGDMSPAALAGRVTASPSGKSAVARGKGGDLADISAVGSRFMTEPKTSMTTERGTAYGILGGSAFADPHITALLYALANLYNRAGPSVARGMIPPPP